MPRTLKRLEDSRWNYQPVGSIDTGELQPDAGQIGRGSWEAFPLHEDTNASSNYAPPPDVVQSPIPSTRGRWRTHNRFPTGHPNTVAPIRHDSPTGAPIWNTSGGQYAVPSGAPSVEPLQTQLHEQLTTSDEVGLGIIKEVPKPSFWQRLFGVKEVQNLEDTHVQGVGENLDGSARNTAIDESGQFYQVPNIRSIANTPAIPGVAIVNGRPFALKAGTPTTPVEFAAQSEHVDGNEYDSIMGDVDNFNTWTGQSNRTVAGAQDPNAPENRPSRSKALYGPYFTRKFDQLAGSPHGLKAILPSPRAATPIATDREQIVPAGFHYGAQGGDPSRTTAPGMTPVGPLPNTDRQIPGPWDYDLNSYSAGSGERRRYGRG